MFENDAHEAAIRRRMPKQEVREIREITPADVALEPERRKRTVMIYVRKVHEDEKTVSINPIPDGVDPSRCSTPDSPWMATQQRSRSS